MPTRGTRLPGSPLASQRRTSATGTLGLRIFGSFLGVLCPTT